jgi:formamidopyrimidine-DNA glycosylase
MKTCVVCVLPVVGNIFADEILLRYALHPTERFAEAAGYLFFVLHACFS